MNAVKLSAMRGSGRGGACGSAAWAVTPPTRAEPGRGGAPDDRVRSGKFESEGATSWGGTREEAGLSARQVAEEEEFPIGPSPERHDFRESAERKSRRPPSPIFVGRGWGVEKTKRKPVIIEASNQDRTLVSGSPSLKGRGDGLGLCVRFSECVVLHHRWARTPAGSHPAGTPVAKTKSDQRHPPSLASRERGREKIACRGELLCST
jgi:hypothetical protein